MGTVKVASGKQVDVGTSANNIVQLDSTGKLPALDGSALTGTVGGGGVVGPASATDNALASYDLTTGKLLQVSAAVIDDSGNVTGITSLFLTEKAAAETDVPGKGQLWVKDDTPNTFWFTDDDGNDYELTGDVSGPASAVNDAIVRFDGTSGKILQDYTSGAPTIGDTGIMTVPSGMVLEGETLITYDIGIADDDMLQVDDASAAAGESAVFTANGLKGQPQVHQYSITVEDPTASEDIAIGFTFVAITVTEVQAVVVGTSCTIDPYHNTDRSAGGGGTDILDNATAITNTTTGQNLTSFTDETIPADSWIVLATTAITACTEVTVTIRYTID